MQRCVTDLGVGPVHIILFGRVAIAIGLDLTLSP